MVGTRMHLRVHRVKDLMGVARGESQLVSAIIQGRNGLSPVGFGLDRNAHVFGGSPGGSVRG